MYPSSVANKGSRISFPTNSIAGQLLVSESVKLLELYTMPLVAKLNERLQVEGGMGNLGLSGNSAHLSLAALQQVVEELNENARRTQDEDVGDEMHRAGGWVVLKPKCG